jgi:hypothetical protein
MARLEAKGQCSFVAHWSQIFVTCRPADDFTPSGRFYEGRAHGWRLPKLAWWRLLSHEDAGCGAK